MSILQSSGLLEHLEEFTPQAIERWLGAALAEAAALREHDDLLYPHDSERQAAAEQLHAAWRRWAEEAQRLLNRAEVASSNANKIAGMDTLRDVLGRTQAMLKLTPAMIAKRREQVLRGEVYTMEEVRRELRAGVRG